MPDEVFSYLEMCRRENARLRRGMNFNLNGAYSVILMSVRADAPYRDRFEDGGTTLIYEGHDQSKTVLNLEPKQVDQPAVTSSGALTQNGLFYRAAERFKAGRREPETVRVYEKIQPAVWSYNGAFHLVDAWQETDGGRQVFKFKLAAVAGNPSSPAPAPPRRAGRQLVPSHVKQAVWQRDGGRCAVCGAAEELRFSRPPARLEDAPPLTADDIRLLCARHDAREG